MKVKVCIAVALLCTASMFAQEAGKAPAMDPMMEAMVKAGTPGDAHKALDGMAGSWDAAVSMWPMPGGEPMKSNGTAESRWVFGGRYLEQRFSGSMMGAPFEGIGYTGYDNIKQQYWGTWMDSMSTAAMSTTGSRDGNSWTFKGMMPDPMSGKDAPFEERVSVKDHDHHTFEMWGPGPDGKVYKMMEIQYTRKK